MPWPGDRSQKVSCCQVEEKSLFTYGSCGAVWWEGKKMYRKWVLWAGSWEREEPWGPSARVSSRVPLRSPSRMACMRCRFLLGQCLSSWVSWWDLLPGTFLIQKATRGWSFGWKLSTAFGVGSRAVSFILGTWGGGTRSLKLQMTTPGCSVPTGYSADFATYRLLCELKASFAVNKALRFISAIELNILRGL